MFICLDLEKKGSAKNMDDFFNFIKFAFKTAKLHDLMSCLSLYCVYNCQKYVTDR